MTKVLATPCSGVPRVSGANGAKMRIGAPYPRRVGLAIGWGGLGRSPSRQRFLEYLGVNGINLWHNFNTIFNSTCQTDKRRKRFPLLLGKGGLGRSPSRQRYWEHLGVNGTHFWIALTLFSKSACKYWQTPKALIHRYWGVWGWAPAANAFGKNLGVNGTHFSIALTTFWTLLAPTAGMQPAARIVRVSFGNSQRGAAANFTGACRQAHIWGLWHVHQNARLYVLLLHRGAEMWMGRQNGRL